MPASAPAPSSRSPSASAVATLDGLDLDAGTIARLLDRGARSSIGIATFAAGGVVLDGGRGAREERRRVLSRLPFPEPGASC